MIWHFKQLTLSHIHQIWSRWLWKHLGKAAAYRNKWKYNDWFMLKKIETVHNEQCLHLSWCFQNVSAAKTLKNQTIVKFENAIMNVNKFILKYIFKSSWKILLYIINIYFTNHKRKRLLFFLKMTDNDFCFNVNYCFVVILRTQKSIMIYIIKIATLYFYFKFFWVDL